MVGDQVVTPKAVTSRTAMSTQLPPRHRVPVMLRRTLHKLVPAGNKALDLARLTAPPAAAPRRSMPRQRFAIREVPVPLLPRTLQTPAQAMGMQGLRLALPAATMAAVVRAGVATMLALPASVRRIASEPFRFMR